jgi:hypothetical protein
MEVLAIQAAEMFALAAIQAAIHAKYHLIYALHVSTANIY